MRLLFRAYEFMTFVLAICMISAGIMGLYVKGFNGNPPLPSLAVQLPIMLSMAIVLIVRLKETTFGVLSAAPYVALGLLAVASFKWSVKPTFTLVEGITALLFIVYLATMAWRYSWARLIDGMWYAMFGMVILSIILYFGVPSIGRMSETHVGTMSGLWVEKNAAGQIGVFGAGLALARLAVSPKTAPTSLFSFLIFTAFLLMTTSKTSLVAYILGCAAFGWVFMMRRNTPVFLVTTWVTVVGGFFAVNWVKANTAEVLGMLGRSSTFTGRADIWKALEISLAERPLLGHGYGGYWDEDLMGTSLSYLLEELKYMPNHSHNSYLEMKLSLGMVGAVILGASLAAYFIITLLRVRRTHGSYFAIPFTVSALIIGSFESVLASPGNFAGAVIVLVAAKSVRPVLYWEGQSNVRRFFMWMGQKAAEQRGVRPIGPRPVRPRPVFSSPRSVQRMPAHVQPAMRPAQANPQTAHSQPEFKPFPGKPSPRRPEYPKQAKTNQSGLAHFLTWLRNGPVFER